MIKNLTPKILFHLSDEDLNDNNIPDYIDEVGIIADSTRFVLVDLLGFDPEPEDEDGIYDIFIQDMGYLYYGLTVFDDQSGQPAGPSYMKIDNEYEEQDYFTSGINTMRLTVAHEFFHAIQRNYKAYPNNSTLFFYEMSSTWIEDLIVPDGDDYLNWTNSFFNNPEIEIDDTDGYSIALYAHYLNEVVQNESDIDGQIIKKMWENFSTQNSAVTAIDNVLNSDYNIDFSDTWLAFTTSNLYNGTFSTIENDIYYYEDQIHANPINVNFATFSEDLEISDLQTTHKKVRIKSYDNLINTFLSVYYDPLISSTTIGNIAISGDNHEIINLENADFLDLSADDNFTIIVSSYANNVVDVFLDSDSYEYGDINQDLMINVIDINLIINYIVSNIELNEFQMILSDVNSDTIINVVDIISIVNIILNPR